MSAAPLLQVDLTSEDIADLFRDLSELVDMQSVQIEDGGGTKICRLDEAFAAFEARTTTRALLRYAYNGRTWLDTLIVVDSGLRLIRIAEDDAMDASSDS